MPDFAPQRRELARRRRERLARGTQGLPFVRRIDPAFVVLFAAGTLALLAFWSIWVGAGWRSGLFDPPLVRPLPDERILTNVRAGLDERPLLAAAVHRGRLWVAQKGGEIHRYDPATELWTSGRPFAGDPPEISDLVDLRSGCGTRTDGCADPRSLWALSEAGGLARRGADGDWTAIFGETVFQDANGDRPSTGDLTSAALSDDGRWLLFGTREHGVGLFDQERRRWVTLEADDLDHLPSPAVSQLRWWNDRFWIGGPEGLAFLRPADPGARIGLREDLGGSVEDLEAGDALWVLESRRCVNDPELACTKLSRLADPERAAEALVYEASRYPDLDLEGLRAVRVQKLPRERGSGPDGEEEDILVLAGRAGLFTYDPARHTWKRLVEEPVSAHYTEEHGGFWAGTVSEAVYVTGGRVAGRWSLPGERVRRLAPAPGGGMMVLTDGRDIWSLLADGETARVFASTSTRFDPRTFSGALTLTDGEVLFLARDGVMIHDVAGRSYRDVPRGQVPGWLFDPNARFAAAGRRLFALLPPAGPAGTLETVLTADPDQLAAGDYDQPGRVPSPVGATAPWDGEGLAMIAGDGSAYLARRETVHRLTGVPARDLEPLAWNDVALDAEKLAVATEQGVRTYLLRERSWQDWTLRGIPVRELALTSANGRASASSERLRMRTADGRLARPDPSDPFLIGDRNDWGGAGARLTDALFDRGQIFLAGENRVHRYDPVRRRLSRSWELASPSLPGPVRLAGVVGSGVRAEPLSWAGGRAYLGAVAVDPEAGRVRGLSLGERYIWTVREPRSGGPLYLKGHYKNRPFDPGLAHCLFRHASAGAGRPLDAREVRPRLVAVATTSGLRLYSRDTRSWYDVRRRGAPLASGGAGPGTTGGILHRIGDLLALWTEDAAGGRLVFLSLDDLALPESCGSRAVVAVEPELAVDALDVAFDEASGTAAWVLPDGAVRQWRAGRVETLLTATRGAPRTGDLKRVFRAGDKLVFTTGLGLAVYDLAYHRWTQHLVVPPGADVDDLADLDLAGPAEGAADGALTLTATTSAGAVYVGAFDPAAPRGTLELTALLAPRARRRGSLGAGPEELLDVQWRLGKWAFVLPDRLAVYDPETRRWEAGLSFPGAPDPGLSLRQAVGLDVLVKDGGREWWIERDPLSRSDATSRWARFRPGDAVATAVDEKARVWRLGPGGRVDKCEPRGAEYACAVALAADASDPVVALEAGPGGAGLRARRRSGRAPGGEPEDLTGLSVEPAPALPPAVDVGWLAWVRGPEPAFQVATAAGPETFSRREFLRGGRFLFEDVRAVTADGARVHAATPHGVWTFRGRSLALARRNPATFLPAALGPDVRAAHGRFFTPEASLLPAAGRLEPDPDPRHRVEIGRQITFVERIREAAVDGRIRTRAGTLSAFAGEGFVWDRRRSVAYHPRLGLLLATGAGIHPLRIDGAADTFDPGPNGRARSGGRLRSTPDGRLYFHDAGAGYLLTARGWSRAAGAGVFDRTLVDNSFWTWSRRDGQLRIVLREGHRREAALEPGADGWQWDFDRLIAAAFHRGRLHLLTGAFLEITGENVGTGSLAELHPAPAADGLESLVPRPGADPELYAWTGGTSRRNGGRPDASRPDASRWNEAAARFDPLAPGDDPLENRDLVRYGPLRIALEGGRVVPELRVEDPRIRPASRRPQWKRFRPSSGGFPFDHVTAVGAVDGHLLVDSPAGLQVYPAGTDGAGLGDVETIYDLGAGASPGTVRLGRPADDPRRFLVVAGGRCFEWKTTLEPCSGNGSLAERWRAESGLWRFTERGGRARGFYKDAGGRLSQTPAVLGGGRFAHDRLVDLALCGDEAAGLWDNGWISLHRDRTLSLAGARSSGELAAGRPRELACVSRPRDVPGGRLEAGLYAAGAGGRFWRREGDGWTVVADPARRQALTEAPLQQYGRLRLARDGPRGGFAYRYQARDGSWIELPWSSSEGRLAIDVIDDFRMVDGKLWTVGPAGVAAFGIGGDGKLRLEPDDLTWIREPSCRITDWRLEGRRAVVRCDHDSRLLFAGSLEPGVDAGVFAPVDGPDPFVEQAFVTERQSGYWDWRLAGRREGAPGRMQARLRGEPLGLAGGRFDFDHLTSIALEAPGRIELASAVGGWYRQAGAGLHVRDLGRPGLDGEPRAEEVTRIAVSGRGERRGLCVETRPGTAFLIRDGAVRASARECSEALGSDAVWSYSRESGGLRIRAPGVAGGWAERGLAAGRLTDQIVLGLPVTANGGSAPLHHLVPTAAGVLRFDAGGAPAAVYAPEHDGLEPGAVPPVLYVDPRGRAVFVTASGVRDLESGELLSGSSFQVPEEAGLTAIEETAAGFLRLRWIRGDERGWSLLRPGDYAAAGENVLPLDAATWGRFVRGRMEWTDAPAVLGLKLLAGGWQIFTRDGERSVDLPWKGPARPIAVLPEGPRLFVVEAGELSEHRLDLGVEELFR